MKKALKIIFISLITIVALAGIALLITPREKLLLYVTPEVRYVTVTNAVITDTIATMDVQLEVTSKLIPVFVDSLVYHFELYNERLAQGRQQFAAASKVDNVQKLSIPVKIDHTKARQLVKRQVVEGEKLQAHVEAYCRIPVIGTRRFDINREVDMAIPVVPGADLIGSKTLTQNRSK